MGRATGFNEVIQAAQASGTMAPLVLAAGATVVLATNPEARQAVTDVVVSGAKTIWGGLQKAGEGMMTTSEAIKKAIVDATENISKLTSRNALDNIKESTSDHNSQREKTPKKLPHRNKTIRSSRFAER